jgi:hypothetical protein
MFLFTLRANYQNGETSVFCSWSHDVVIRVYDAAGNVIETHEHAREFESRASGVTFISQPAESIG